MSLPSNSVSKSAPVSTCEGLIFLLLGVRNLPWDEKFKMLGAPQAKQISHRRKIRNGRLAVRHQKGRLAVRHQIGRLAVRHQKGRLADWHQIGRWVSGAGGHKGSRRCMGGGRVCPPRRKSTITLGTNLPTGVAVPKSILFLIFAAGQFYTHGK